LSLPSFLYGHVARLRRQWYARHAEARRGLRQPVISVGNLTVGGSGKTPAVAHLARVLSDLGERPSVLSRGYKRAERADGVVVVSDGRTVRADLRRSGDEPMMLARSLQGVPVLVAEDRHLAAALQRCTWAAPSTCSTMASSTWNCGATSIWCWQRRATWQTRGPCRLAACASRSRRFDLPMP
jgi:hypothetical protein